MMINTRRTNPTSPQQQAGFTLIELVTSMSLFSILLVLGATVVVSAQRFNNTSREKADSTRATSLTSDVLIRHISSAIKPANRPSAFIIARPQQLSFYASLDRTSTQNANRPSLVEYRYDAATNCLMQRVTAPTGADNALAWNPTGPEQCLTRLTAAPTFSYYADTRAVVSGTTPTPIQPVPTSVAATDVLPTPAATATAGSKRCTPPLAQPYLTCVNAVGVNMQVASEAAGGKVGAIPFQVTVSLTNWRQPN